MKIKTSIFPAVLLLVVALACRVAELPVMTSVPYEDVTATPLDVPNQPTFTIVPEPATSAPSLAPLKLSIQPIPKESPKAFKIFEKYVDVFGVHIYANDNVPDEKLLHAAQVMAQYLDNDEDGVYDNPKIIDAMIAKSATLFMFNREGSAAEDQFMDMAEVLHDNGVALQPLYGAEVFPNGSAHGEFDATLEEVLHLITSAGYADAYPDVWGEEPGTQVANVMDAARGGHFESVPAVYPPNAWYTYDDETCEYDCMITEYIYWSLTSILGAQDFPGRLEMIENEWRLNTAEKMRTGDPMMYKMLTDPFYHFPTTLPDGHYRP